MITALDSVKAEVLTTRYPMRRKIADLLGRVECFDVTQVVSWLMAMNLKAIDGWEMIGQLDCVVPPYTASYLEWEDESVRSSALVAYRGDRIVGNVWDTGSYHGHRTSEFLGAFETRIDRGGSPVTILIPDGRRIAEVAVNLSDDLAEGLRLKRDVGHAREAQESAQLIVDGVAMAAAICLFTFDLLNCANVRAVDQDPRKEMTRQQIRAQERSGRPFIIYKTLVVKPIRSYRARGATQGTGTRKRMHRVRGHYVYYGPKYDRGLLFGKYEGRFFVPPHVRGDAELGEVRKTYRVQAPSTV